MKLTLVLVLAVVFAFVVGAAGGYAARGLNTSPVAAVSAHGTNACSAGTHAVVWYSAHAWSCVPN